MLPKKVDLNQRLKELVNSAPVMIFMKGEPKVGKGVVQGTFLNLFILKFIQFLKRKKKIFFLIL